VASWLSHFLIETGFFPNPWEMNSVRKGPPDPSWARGEMTLEAAWEVYEVPEAKERVPWRSKIVTLEEAAQLAEACRDNEARVGYAGGKWRLGDTNDQGDFLETAKRP
jgi:hypothetical protein